MSYVLWDLGAQPTRIVRLPGQRHLRFLGGWNLWLDTSKSAEQYKWPPLRHRHTMTGCVLQAFEVQARYCLSAELAEIEALLAGLDFVRMNCSDSSRWNFFSTRTDPKLKTVFPKRILLDSQFKG